MCCKHYHTLLYIQPWCGDVPNSDGSPYNPTCLCKPPYLIPTVVWLLAGLDTSMQVYPVMLWTYQHASISSDAVDIPACMYIQ